MQGQEILLVGSYGQTPGKFYTEWDVRLVSKSCIGFDVRRHSKGDGTSPAEFIKLEPRANPTSTDDKIPENPFTPSQHFNMSFPAKRLTKIQGPDSSAQITTCLLTKYLHLASKVLRI